jgi:hypothetical protein
MRTTEAVLVVEAEESRGMLGQQFSFDGGYPAQITGS